MLASGGRLLIVERKLKRSSGHGLDRAGAELLAQLLESHGYASVEIETIKIGRPEYLAVSAVEP